MKKIAFWLSLLLALLFCMPALAREDALTHQQLRQRLYQAFPQEGEGGPFLVLPEDFRMPTVDQEGEYKLLIVGVDTDRQGMKGRSDTMMLAVFNARDSTLKLVSFMRDLRVSIPGRGNNRLNASYAFGGISLLRRTLESNFGVGADGYLAVDYSLMIELVDAIGGITLHVADFELQALNGILSYYNYLNDIPEERGVLARAGTQRLTGLQAMSYARIRKPDSDFERVQRQQKTLEAIYAQLTALPVQQLADVIIRYMGRVSTDISMATALGLLQDVLEAGTLRVESLRIPVEGAYDARVINRAYFLMPDLEKNKRALMEFLLAAPLAP